MDRTVLGVAAWEFICIYTPCISTPPYTRRQHCRQWTLAALLPWQQGPSNLHSCYTTTTQHGYMSTYVRTYVHADLHHKVMLSWHRRRTHLGIATRQGSRNHVSFQWGVQTLKVLWTDNNRYQCLIALTDVSPCSQTQWLPNLISNLKQVVGAHAGVNKHEDCANWKAITQSDN